MKNKDIIFSKTQIVSLVILRMLIGWHLLYEGIAKLLMQNWSSVGFLSESQWVMSGIAKWIISHDLVLAIVDAVNIWGLIAIGVSLILGMFSKSASLAGAFLLFIYFLNNAPIIGIEYSVPSEGNYLIVNKTLIESATLFVLYLFPTSCNVGLDFYLKKVSIFKNRI